MVESHVAAIAIAVLLSESAYVLFQWLWLPISDLVNDSYNYAAADFFDAPYFFRYFGVKAFFGVQPIVLLSSYAIVLFTAAWILSQLVYGMGPFRALSAHRAKLTRNRHA